MFLVANDLLAASFRPLDAIASSTIDLCTIVDHDTVERTLMVAPEIEAQVNRAVHSSNLQRPANPVERILTKKKTK